ncbi:MAG: SUMF1/EgtB/PvdO family nonheme iron enzyme, partial [Myxococcota bacterium]
PTPLGLALWDQDRELHVRPTPSGLAAILWRYQSEPDGTYTRIHIAAAQPTPIQWELQPGSYLIELAAGSDTTTVRYPFSLPSGAERASDTRAIDLAIPDAIPAGYVYIPPGSFLFGFGRRGEEEFIRRWYETMPLHERTTDEYLIAEHETTIEDWITYLRQLDPEERALRMPRTDPGYHSHYVRLVEERGQFALYISPNHRERPSRLGQPVLYDARPIRRKQDWQTFPVTGITADDAQAYTEWLAATRVPGARLCREDEWERAARGADGRVYPHGDRLNPDDANYDQTYGRVEEAFGLDQVGSHRRSQSPFGLHDMIGNVNEFTRSFLDRDQIIARGGSFFNDKSTGAAANRLPITNALRFPYLGLRVCADLLRTDRPAATPKSK